MSEPDESMLRPLGARRAPSSRARRAPNQWAADPESGNRRPSKRATLPPAHLPITDMVGLVSQQASSESSNRATSPAFDEEDFSEDSEDDEPWEDFVYVYLGIKLYS
eukprot:SAG31_NODE_6043_length_2194_cov_5.787112_4_plen_107_part_00